MDKIEQLKNDLKIMRVEVKEQDEEINVLKIEIENKEKNIRMHQGENRYISKKVKQLELENEEYKKALLIYETNKEINGNINADNNRFNSLAQDYHEFKKYTLDTFSKLIKYNYTEDLTQTNEIAEYKYRLNILEEKNKSLEEIIREKDLDSVYKNSNADDNCDWENVHERNKHISRGNEEQCRNYKDINHIQLHNRFDGIHIDDNAIEIEDTGIDGNLIDDTGTSQIKIITNQYSNKDRTNISRRPNTVINENAESDIREYGTKTVPGNGSYSRITSKGKRIHIYGASLIKRLKGKEMARFIKLKNKTFIRPFPGNSSLS